MNAFQHIFSVFCESDVWNYCMDGPGKNICTVDSLFSFAERVHSNIDLSSLRTLSFDEVIAQVGHFISFFPPERLETMGLDYLT